MLHFRFLYRLALRDSFADGQVTQENYDILMNALRRPRRRKKEQSTEVDLMDEIEKYTMQNLPAQWSGTDPLWQRIVEWLKAHWVEILKVLLTFLPLFLADADTVE